MKSIAYVWVAAVLLVGVLGTLAGAQSGSLGDYAREARKEKKQPAAKQFDNDNIPKQNKLNLSEDASGEPDAKAAEKPADKSAEAPSDTPADTDANPEENKADGTEASPDADGQAQSGEKSQVAAKSEQQPEDSAKKAEASPEPSAEDRQKANDAWEKKISAQKDKVDLLTRELEVAQREYRLRAAAFYADAGDRLRNSTAWDQEDAQFKKQITDKQKAVDDAKKELEDLQEQARKSGVPSGSRE